MIAKILSSSGSFSAVRYNTNKVDKGDGELMLFENMPFSIDDEVTPEEVRNFFMAQSEGNKTDKPQFHATISCKGKDVSKETLTLAARMYMEEMGYGKQPYLVVFHNDTDNNHVHIVSSRVTAENKLVNNSFEKYRSIKAIREIENKLGLKEKTDEKLRNLLSYTFSSQNGLKVLLERNGYVVVDDKVNYTVYENGELKLSLEKEAIQLSNQDHIHKKQLRAILRKYSGFLSTDAIPIRENLIGNRKGAIIGYESELSNFLKEKFGYDIVYHFKDDKPPFGYTFIDHNNKAVLKGSELYKLRMDLSSKSSLSSLKVDGYNINSEAHKGVLSRLFKVDREELNLNIREVSSTEKEYTKDLINSFLEHSDFSNLRDIGIILIREEGELFLVDINMKNIFSANEILELEQQQNNSMDMLLAISDDVDDEKINRRRRNKIRR